MNTAKIIYFLSFFFFPLCIHAQEEVNCNGTKMSPSLEIAKASISKEKIILVLHELDLHRYEQDNCEDCPSTKSLILDIDFTEGFKFPIREEDSIFIRQTTHEQGLAEHQFNLRQVEQMNGSRNPSEEQKLKSQAAMLEKKAKEISKQLQEGTISAEEAQQKLLSLSNPYLQNLEQSSINNQSTTEFQAKANFSFRFYNDEQQTTTEAFSGYLYIKEFTEDSFIAEFRGIDIEQCVEKRLARSPQEQAKCRMVTSQYLPDRKVLREGRGYLNINLKIQEFFNNR
jgi:hypothetical protein